MARHDPPQPPPERQARSTEDDGADDVLRLAEAKRRASQGQPGGLPTAPPADIGTDQGAVRPDVPSFRRPR